MAKPTGRVEISIRALEVEDAAELARLQAMPGYRFGTLRTPYPSVASVRRFLERSGSDDLHLGAFIGGRLVGSAGLLRLAGRQRHVASFGMGVADDLNGRGIGTKLLQALMDAADNWLDIRRIELEVFFDNGRAIRLYERHGFEREGLRRAAAFREGRYVDVITMARLKGIPD